MDRSATDAIKGYFYQFDFTILQLLEAPDVDSTVTVEDIEDVDVINATDKTAIQCKYYEGTEYNHSVIKSAIQLIINHYAEVRHDSALKIKYKLYGRYNSGCEKLPTNLTVDFLKEHFLTYHKGVKESRTQHFHHEELGLSDHDLRDFLTLLEINVNGLGYDEQLSKISVLLTSHFACSNSTESDHFYNNALKCIKDLAVQKRVENRSISKSQFLERINNKKELFSAWFMAFKGRKDFFKLMRKEHFSDFNVSPHERIFLIEVPAHNYNRSELKNIVSVVSKRWSNRAIRGEQYCPYLYLHNIPNAELIELKRDLQLEGFSFNDGYDFLGASFYPKSLVRDVEALNHRLRIKIKIINDLGSVDLVLSEISKRKEVYEFYLTDSFFNHDNAHLKHEKIPFIELKDIKDII